MLVATTFTGHECRVSTGARVASDQKSLADHPIAQWHLPLSQLFSPEVYRCPCSP